MYAVYSYAYENGERYPIRISNPCESLDEAFEEGDSILRHAPNKVMFVQLIPE